MSTGVQKTSSAKMGSIALGIVAAIIGLVFLAPAIPAILNHEDEPPEISILSWLRQEPKVVPQEELVAQALEQINKDRASFGLGPVNLSSNVAAQIHAEDVFSNKQISHWLSNGEKPYMTYSRNGGTGGMEQNVAVAGFSKEQYEQCRDNRLYDCEKIEPVTTIKELEYEMMYDDMECCADGHRNNILNKFHTDVSIGLVYDKLYLVLVQNFENNYGLDIGVTDGSVQISGQLELGTLEHVAIYYDSIPTPEVYEQNKHMLSYSGGELVAVALKPLPPGFFYERTDDYKLVEAKKWADSGDVPIDISFDLAKVVDAGGIYTISVVAKTENDETFEAASYSVFVDSETGPQS